MLCTGVSIFFLPTDMPISTLKGSCIQSITFFELWLCRRLLLSAVIWPAPLKCGSVLSFPQAQQTAVLVSGLEQFPADKRCSVFSSRHLEPSTRQHRRLSEALHAEKGQQDKLKCKYPPHCKHDQKNYSVRFKLNARLLVFGWNIEALQGVCRAAEDAPLHHTNCDAPSCR